MIYRFDSFDELFVLCHSFSFLLANRHIILYHYITKKKGCQGDILPLFFARAKKSSKGKHAKETTDKILLCKILYVFPLGIPFRIKEASRRCLASPFGRGAPKGRRGGGKLPSHRLTTELPQRGSPSNVPPPYKEWYVFISKKHQSPKRAFPRILRLRG